MAPLPFTNRRVALVMPERGSTVLAIARDAIAGALGLSAPRRLPDAPWLREPGSAFVTLRDHGALRGCIGSLEPYRALGDDIAGNAVAAALHDRRFAPLAPAELASIEVEVSLLAPSEPLPCRDQDDAIRQLRPGIDGVVLEYGRHRATFLPQVWESLPEPVEFLSELKQKAGLPADFWHPDLQLRRYGVEKFCERNGSNE